MSDYKTNYVSGKPKNFSDEQLLQLLRITHDGDLISKSERSELVKIGFATRSSGFNIITADGIKYLSDNKLIHG